MEAQGKDIQPRSSKILLSPARLFRRNKQGVSEQILYNFTVWRVMLKGLHLKAYKLFIVQHLTDADNVVRKEFSIQLFRTVFHTPETLRSV
jgi:hypothetical protein